MGFRKRRKERETILDFRTLEIEIEIGLSKKTKKTEMGPETKMQHMGFCIRLDFALDSSLKMLQKTLAASVSKTTSAEASLFDLLLQLV